MAHLHALLGSASAAEREVARFVRIGALRRLGVRRAAELEFLILQTDLAALLENAKESLGAKVLEEFNNWLTANPAENVVAAGELSVATADALVRHGFLTGPGTHCLLGTRHGETARLRLRPDERASMVSLATVAKAASGSLAAVGGNGVVYEAGGGGGVRVGRDVERGREARDRSVHDLDLAVPGQGAFLRLATAAVEHVVNLIRTRSRYGQVPKSMLREWWDCATPISAETTARRKQRARRKPAAGASLVGRSGRVLPDRTAKWKLLDGVDFEWAVLEAVGMAVVEVFDAGSVGPAIRIL